MTEERDEQRARADRLDRELAEARAEVERVRACECGATKSTRRTVKVDGSVDETIVCLACENDALIRAARDAGK